MIDEEKASIETAAGLSFASFSASTVALKSESTGKERICSDLCIGRDRVDCEAPGNGKTRSKS
jgi:hypothetical protein